MLSELRTEDAGEVRFQAGPAQSVAELEVEGKNCSRAARGRRQLPCDWQAGSPSSGRCLPHLPSWRALLGQVTEGSEFPEEVGSCGLWAGGCRGMSR